MPSPVSSLPPPTEGVMLSQPSTRLFVNSTPFGAGTLVLAHSRLSWLSDAAAASRFSLEYKGVSIHAVSRDVSKFPHRCLYLMVDGKVDDDVARCVPAPEEAAPMDADDDADDDTDDDDDDDEDPVTEIRFVPADDNQLDVMFAVMSDCQALHPDSEEDNLSGDDEEEEEEEENVAVVPNGVNGHGVIADDEDEEEEDLIDGGAAAGDCPTEAEMTSQGLATLRRLEQMLGGGGGGGGAAAAAANSEAAQFEDADDDMES